MNKNTEYEVFTQKIYQSLLKAERKDTIIVEHNKKIKGRSGQSHQIDVYWEYEIAGIMHKVAIECKNYKSTISIGKIRDFNSVVTDIGNIIGIIVTKIGFQKGSLEFANHYGINLKILKEPEFDDWKNFGELMMMSMELKGNTKVPKNKRINIDKEWVKLNYEDKLLIEKIYSGHRINENSPIVDSEGKFIKTLKELEKEMPTNFANKEDLIIRKDFDDCFILMEEIGIVKILGIQFEFELKPFTKKIVNPTIENTIGVLKDPKTGEKKFIEKDGTVK